MAAQMQGDEQLLVRFYSEVNTSANPPRDEEWVSIRTPATNDEFVGKAHSFSHTDEAGQQYTYAQRFAAHYGAFKKGDNTEARREELLKKAAALDAKADFIETEAEKLGKAAAEKINVTTAKLMKEKTDKPKTLAAKAMVKAKILAQQNILKLMAKTGINIS